MYAETELLFPFFHNNFSQGFQELDDLSSSHKSNCPTSTLFPTSTISEYDLGGEGDLCKALAEPIVEKPIVAIHPMTPATSITSSSVAVIESTQNEQLLSDVFYEAMEFPLSDILDIKIPVARTEEKLVSEDKLPPERSYLKEALVTPFSDILDIKYPIRTEENLIADDKLPLEDTLHKSVSSGCLSSNDWIHGAPMRPNFLGFSGMDLGVDYGMRRAFSEGDIKTLGNGNISLVHSPHGQSQIISNCTTEDRKIKLSRYRNKKMKRNFGRKIKYACRKALADSQPRIRGRFAKTQESDILKKQLL